MSVATGTTHQHSGPVVVPPPPSLASGFASTPTQAVRPAPRARGSVLILDGTIVSESGQTKADLRIEDGTIVALGPDLRKFGADQTIDATGLYVLPGVIDPHVHFNLDTGTGRSADDFASGSASAVAGGVTTYLHFAIQKPGQTFRESIAATRSEAAGSSFCDFGFHLIPTDMHSGWESELHELVKGGVSSIKVFTAYKGTPLYLDDWTIYRIMQLSGKAGMLLQMHAENDDMVQGRTRELESECRTSYHDHGESRPAVAEAEAVNRGVFFSALTRSPIYFVHLSNPLSVDVITAARRSGLHALAETCPHYLALDDTVYQGETPERYLVAPPVRESALRDGMWDRLAKREVHTVGSDHCGYALCQRPRVGDFRKISVGIPGVETTLPLLASLAIERGDVGMAGIVRLLSGNPARIFGLWPKKGQLAVGADADVVLLDPSARAPLSDSELHTAAEYSPFAGLQFQARVRTTLSRGQVVYDRGKVVGGRQWGQFIKRNPFDASSQSC